jgi:hypothetical protein
VAAGSATVVTIGRAMAGLVAAVQDGAITPGDRIVFLHTGGLPSLFGHPDAISRAEALLGTCPVPTGADADPDQRCAAMPQRAEPPPRRRTRQPHDPIDVHRLVGSVREPDIAGPAAQGGDAGAG